MRHSWRKPFLTSGHERTYRRSVEIEDDANEIECDANKNENGTNVGMGGASGEANINYDGGCTLGHRGDGFRAGTGAPDVGRSDRARP